MRERLYTALFVFLWSTGFIGARLGLPHAEPLTFLLCRYALVVLLMTAIALSTKAPWPQGRTQWLHIAVTGVLMQALYLGGVFSAIKQGVPAGVTSLIVGMQPLLTGVVAFFLLREKVTFRQWIGLLLGLVGTLLVLSDRLSMPVGGGGILWALAGLFGITVGTLYQKHFSPSFDWRTGSVVQFSAAAAVTSVGALAMEQFHIEPTFDLAFALAWLVLVLSIGAMSLLNHLIRSGTASKVVSLFYLVPPCTATIAWLLFHDLLSWVALLGMAIAVWGVALARR